MKKSFFLIISILIMLIHLCSISSYAYPRVDFGPLDFDMLLADFYNKDGRIMSIAHRGDWKNFPENSIPAIESCIQIGVDIVEIDVRLTQDGEVVLMHDETVDRTTNGSGKVSDMTLDQIKALHLRSVTPGAPEYQVPTLAEALDVTKGRILVNLDGCFTETLFEKCYNIIKEKDCLREVIFKNGNTAEIQKQWNESYVDSEYPITSSSVFNAAKDDTKDKLQAFINEGITPQMVELISLPNGQEAIPQANIDFAKQHMRVEYCTMHHDKGGYVGFRPENQICWAEIIDRGVDTIMTDRIPELTSYLRAINNTRISTDKLEAEHFNLFDYHNPHDFSLTFMYDELNQKVMGLDNGDWLLYKNISFTGAENNLAINMQSLAAGITVKVYIDSMNTEPAAIFENDEMDGFYTLNAVLNAEIPAGNHDVYLVVEGNEYQDLANIDWFQFSTISDSKAVSVENVFVSTLKGTVPILPQRVNVTFEDDSVFSCTVRWDYVEPSNYEQAGTFTVRGYISEYPSVLPIATVTVNEIESYDVAAADKILWLKADEGITKDVNGKVSCWADSGNHNHNALQSIEANQPVLIENAVNGKPAVSFGTTVDQFYLDISACANDFNNRDEMTIFIYSSSNMENDTALNKNSYSSILYFDENASWGSVYFSSFQNEITGRFGNGISNNRGFATIRSANIGTAYTSVAFCKDGTSESAFINGELVDSRSANANIQNTDHTKGYIGRGKYDSYFGGSVCEIIIFEKALTDNEIKSVELYLSNKYSRTIQSADAINVTTLIGEPPELPKTINVTYSDGTSGTEGVIWDNVNPYSYAEAGSYTVNGIAGGFSVTASVTVKKNFEVSDDLIIWFKADAGVTADPTTGKVSEWADSSGNGHNATQVVASNQPTLIQNALNGKPTLMFSKDNATFMNFNVDEDNVNGKQEMTVFIYTAANSDSMKTWEANTNDFYSVLKFNDRDPGWGSLYLGATDTRIGGRFGTGEDSGYTYPNIGDTGNRGFHYKRPSLVGVYTSTAMRKDGANETLYSNGEVIDTRTAGTTTANIDPLNAYIGSSNGTTRCFDGNICEIMIYNRALTDEEMAKVERYLFEKYNAEIPEDDLIIWFKADAGVTADPTTGKVSEWADSSGNGHNATQEKELDRPTLVENAVNGKPAVKFDYFASSTPLETDQRTHMTFSLADEEINGKKEMTAFIYTAAASDKMVSWEANSNEFYSILYFHDKPDTTFGRLYFGATDTRIGGRFGTGEASGYDYWKPNQGNLGFQYKRPSLIGTYTSTAFRKDGANETLYLNGEVIDKRTAGDTIINVDTLNGYIGCSIGSRMRCFDGNICEILLFNRALSDREMARVEKYLYDKYTVVDSKVYVSGIYLAESVLELNNGSTHQLNASVIPNNADEQGITYRSLNPNVATVSDTGVVTTTGYGTTTILAITNEGNFKAECKITVPQPEIEKRKQELQDLINGVNALDPTLYNADKYDEMHTELEEAQRVLDNPESNTEELVNAYRKLWDAVALLLTSEPEPDPEYYFHELISREGVMVSGDISRFAVLTVKTDALHENACEGCKKLEKLCRLGKILKLYDINVNGGYLGILNITIPIGSEYDGRTLSVLHCLNGELQITDVAVRNGSVTIQSELLSPFAVYDGVYDENILIDDETDDTNNDNIIDETDEIDDTNNSNIIDKKEDTKKPEDTEQKGDIEEVDDMEQLAEIRQTDDEVIVEIESQIEGKTSTIIPGASVVTDALQKLMDENKSTLKFTPSSPSLGKGDNANDDSEVLRFIISGDILSAIADSEVSAVVFETSLGKMVIENETIDTLKQTVLGVGKNQDITIQISVVDTEKYPDDLKRLIGNMPVYDFSIMIGDKNLRDITDASVPLILELGNIPEKDPLINENKIVGAYILEDGKYKLIPISALIDGKIVIRTAHNSVYSAVYNNVEFEDVSGWSEDFIAFLSARGVINGKGNNKFDPKSNITRAEFVKMMAMIVDEDTSKFTESSFRDVDVNKWYAPYIEWAHTIGLVNGVGDGMFAPEQNIIRQDMVVLISRFIEKFGYKLPAVNEEKVFKDNADIADYARDSVKTIHKAGIIEGKLNGVFAPKDNTTREEAAKVFTMLIKLIIK